MAQTEQQQATSGTRAAHQDPASSDHHRNQPQHLSIDISASESLLLAPTVPPAAAAAAAAASSSSSRGTSALTKPQRSPSFMLRQTVKSLLPGGSFKSSVRSIIARTSSLPVVSHVVSGTRDDSALSQHKLTPTSPASTALDKEGRIHSYMHRSQSLPMNMKKFNATKSFKRMNSLGGVYRVVPSISTPPTVQETSSHVIPDILLPTESESDDAGEDIAEEEAVCRICMVELSEGSDTLKLECSCKGELALAHRGCAFKWFSIKGTRTCEVCKDEVQNLPVTLVRVQSMQQPDTTRLTNAHINTSRYYRYRTWRGTPILVIISILAYFCFLEQLLVIQDGIAALAISLPFSCILGLFSSLTTTSMVARRYVWIYATIQFLFVVFFTHLFYRYLHLQAVISIILATFAGFGVGMTGNSIIVEIIRWRAGRLPPPAQTRHRARRSRPAAQPPPQQQQEEQRDAGVDVENPTVPQPQA